LACDSKTERTWVLMDNRKCLDLHEDKVLLKRVKTKKLLVTNHGNCLSPGIYSAFEQMIFKGQRS